MPSKSKRTGLSPRGAEILLGMKSTGRQTMVYVTGPGTVAIYFRARLENGDESFDLLKFDHGAQTKAGDAVWALVEQLGRARMTDDSKKLLAFMEGQQPGDTYEPAVVILNNADRPGIVGLVFKEALESGNDTVFGLSYDAAHDLGHSLLHTTGGCEHADEADADAPAQKLRH